MKAKKLVSIILIFVLAVSLLALPTSAENSRSAQDEYPFVFVHGLLGWGEESGLYDVLPYWGMTTGNLLNYLQLKGYDCYAAQVGPLTSAWDRVCELYAQLTGTTVDYGIAHSAEKGHDRFGVTFDEPLFEGWSAEKKINLIGHSFGGATSRLFVELLTNGCPEEVEAAKAAGVEVSPLFEGGKGDWVYSVTCVSAPHNGSSFHQACPLSTKLLIEMVYDIGNTLDIADMKGVYDLRLEHFGIVQGENETDLQFIERILCSTEFMSHNDNAVYDLTIDNALAINDKIEMQDGIYYFSIAGDCTKLDRVTGNYVPDASTCLLLRPFARLMGSYCDEYTPGGVYIDKTWLKNDGLVNLTSGLYPKNSKLEAEPYVLYDGVSAKNFKPGVWNVMPTMPYDHLSAVGGLFSNTTSNIRNLYLDLIDNVTSTYDIQPDSPSGFHGFLDKLFSKISLRSLRDFLLELFSIFNLGK